MHQIDTLKPAQDGGHYAGDFFKPIFPETKVCVSQKFVHRSQFSALIQVMAWCQLAPNHSLNQWWLSTLSVYNNHKVGTSWWKETSPFDMHQIHLEFIFHYEQLNYYLHSYCKYNPCFFIYFTICTVISYCIVPMTRYYIQQSNDKESIKIWFWTEKRIPQLSPDFELKKRFPNYHPLGKLWGVHCGYLGDINCHILETSALLFWRHLYFGDINCIKDYMDLLWTVSQTPWTGITAETV